ncbi:MAG TPA: 30S ribosomal protein S8 [Armatimonadota bacterium]|jgi:small subunit ribosomal protein S8
MTVTDPIADLLTRIRNANAADHDTLEVPKSKLKLEVVKVLHQEGYLKRYELVEDNKGGAIRVYLKYGPKREKVLTQLKRISKPGRRVYVGSKDTPRVLSGLGIAILTTPQGVMTDRRARKLGVGGEVLCYVW